MIPLRFHLPALVLGGGLLAAPCLAALRQVSPRPLVQSTRLVQDDPDPDDRFGSDVAVDGTTIAVAASTFVGADEVTIFDETAAGWQRVVVLEMSAPVPAASSLALQGDTLVVGSRDSVDGGMVSVFERDAGGPDAWARVWSSFPPPSPFPGFIPRSFGQDVAVAGPYIFVGDIMFTLDPVPGANRGAVFAFRALEGESSWNWVSTLAVEWSFHFGRALAADGDLVAVGGDRTVWIYRRTPGEDDWQLEQVLVSTENEFGEALDLQGDLLLVGLPTLQDSRAQLFRRDQGGPGMWGLVTTLVPSFTSICRFGNSTAIGEDVLYVGASGLVCPEAAFVHTFVADPSAPGGWRTGHAFEEPPPNPSSGFGWALAASGRLLAAGAPFAANNRGRAWALRVHQPEQALAPAPVPARR